MRRKYKAYIRINIISIFFIVVSFVSVTLAWFAYTGLSTVSTEIGVKAWNIELKKNNEIVSNDIVISLSDIYPGMQTINETVNIKNLGDSDAQLKYSIISARLLADTKDNYTVDDNTESSYVEDILSHEYPFHININLSKHYVLAKGDQSSFEVSVSWPLDSNNDKLDSTWGTKAYQFQESEKQKKALNSNYQVEPSLKISISLTAEQYLENDDSSDLKYYLGKEILYDIKENKLCQTINTTCLKTHVIDIDSKISNKTISLLPDPSITYTTTTYNNYSSTLSSLTSNWAVNTRALLINDMLPIISTDINNSYLVRNEMSNAIIGNINYTNRITKEIQKATTSNGYYQFNNTKFNYLLSDTCYWINNEYNATNGFSIKKEDNNFSKLKNELKSSTCNVVPVIIADKSKL